jgi:hypothetical protein
MSGQVMVAVALGAVVAAGVFWLALRPRPRATLAIREGTALGEEFPLGRKATIGRGEGETIVVSHPRVSRVHAEIAYEDGGFVLRDRSKHGVLVNGEPVTEAVLRSGDLISLADAVDLIFTRR